MVHLSRERGTTVLRLVGVLDESTVAELTSLAQQQPATTPVVIDISGASAVRGAALGRLIAALPPAQARAIRACGCKHPGRPGSIGPRSLGICDCSAEAALIAQSA